MEENTRAGLARPHYGECARFQDADSKPSGQQDLGTMTDYHSRDRTAVWTACNESWEQRPTHLSRRTLGIGGDFQDEFVIGRIIIR